MFINLVTSVIPCMLNNEHDSGGVINDLKARPRMKIVARKNLTNINFHNRFFIIGQASRQKIDILYFTSWLFLGDLLGNSSHSAYF